VGWVGGGVCQAAGAWGSSSWQWRRDPACAAAAAAVVWALGTAGYHCRMQCRMLAAFAGTAAVLGALGIYVALTMP
jgi:hypothetical protein